MFFPVTGRVCFLRYHRVSIYKQDYRDLIEFLFIYDKWFSVDGDGILSCMESFAFVKWWRVCISLPDKIGYTWPKNEAFYNPTHIDIDFGCCSKVTGFNRNVFIPIPELTTFPSTDQVISVLFRSREKSSTLMITVSKGLGCTGVIFTLNASD